MLKTAVLVSGTAHGNVVLVSQTLGSINTGYSGYNARLIIPVTSVLQTWTARNGLGFVALSFSFASSQNGTLDGCYIGWQGTGNAYNFDGNQIKVTFNGGSTSLNQVGAGTVVSDKIKFTALLNKVLVVATHWSGTADGGLSFNSAPAGTNQYLAGASQVGATAPTGTWSSDNFWTFISNIQFTY